MQLKGRLKTYHMFSKTYGYNKSTDSTQSNLTARRNLRGVTTK